MLSDFLPLWQDRGDEKQDTQTFWLSLLNALFPDNPPEIQFEKPVRVDNLKTGVQTTKFIDAYIPETRIVIEQKSRKINLNKPELQSDGSLLTPFQQARRYSGYLPRGEQARYIIVCNFGEFRIHDMNSPNDPPDILQLSDLEKESYRLQFLSDAGKEHLKHEMEVSMAAGELVGLLYDAFCKQYKNPMGEQELKDLNILCVRLVFCLYAEDAGIFGTHGMFHDYLSAFDTSHMRKALKDLFAILGTKPEDRDPYLEEELNAFPYCNGGLFAGDDGSLPPLTDEIRSLLLDKASAGFDWSEISPTIFGAVFESTLNPDTRRKGGMHYTSIENIHKVIDPLFMEELRGELDEIMEIPQWKPRELKLKAFQKKLAGLTFLDPACGSGNFLTETYLSLRRLENEVIAQLQRDQIVLGGVTNPIEVSISQFYGIEINDFAVTVAKTALWIAESQMMKETESIVRMNLDFLPLKTNANITEGNALQTDWETVVHPLASPERGGGPRSGGGVDFIIGNPPFVGYSLQSKAQKEDILSIYRDEKGKPYKTAGKIDYVAGWYFKAAAMMQGTNIRTAFVSTNSITQGEQVAGVWKPLYDRFGIHIDFAHRTFRWDSESSQKAHVHCVIVGFSTAPNEKRKRLFTEGQPEEVEKINPYLVDGETVFIEGRSKPICPVPSIQNGGKPSDGGNLILTEEEAQELLQKEPQAAPLLRPFMMGKDFIDRKPRFCLWLVGANPSLLKQCPSVLKRIEGVRTFRLASQKEATRKKAETPTLFDEVKECKTDYVAIPKVSSENRKYIPMDYLSQDIIAGDTLFMIQDNSTYSFGILTSNIHMAWMRTVCGRLKSDYRYSNTVVYNNFPWPTPTEAQKANIEETAKGILEARAIYPDSSLADLYDERTMPPELRRAHQANDKAVMQAYNFWGKIKSEPACVAALMQLYQSISSP